nr:hypothetical protein Iba_chr13eCG5770 [Ipomoea batatas]
MNTSLTLFAMIGAGRLFSFVRVFKDGESAAKTKKTRINADALSARSLRWSGTWEKQIESGENRDCRGEGRGGEERPRGGERRSPGRGTAGEGGGEEPRGRGRRSGGEEPRLPGRGTWR